MNDLSKRSHPKELATTEEIRAMMAVEAKRNPSSEAHFPDFSIAEEWLSILNVQSDLFENTNSIEEVNEKAEIIKPLVVERTLKIKPYGFLKKIENYLGEEDVLEKADLAIVFGGKTLARAEKGAEMYLQGWVSKLLMTGKGPFYGGKFSKPEAEVFKDRAVELGVPQKDILTEIESINIPSNVRASLNLLDKLNFKYKKIIQVISWYANRRAWVTLKKYLDSQAQIIRVNANLPKEGGVPNGYEKGEWYKTEEGIEIVLNEFVKMRLQMVTNSG